MLEKLNALVEERNSLWENTLKPLVLQDEMTAEEQTTYSEGEAKLEELDEEIKRVTSAIQREHSNDESAERRAELLTAVEGSPVTPDEVVDADERYEEVFMKYARVGFSRLDGEEREVLEARATEERALGTTSGAVGGFTIPEGFVNQIIEGMSAFGGLRNAPLTVITTSDGNDLPVPTSDDTGNSGELIAENVAATEQDVAFGQKILKAWLWSSKLVRVPLTLINDSAFGMESFLAKKFGERIGRAQAGYLITGTGASQPEGIVTNATTGFTSAQTDTLIYNDFVELEHSVDPAYRLGNGSYVLSDDALKEARLIKDLDGRPIWTPGLAGMVEGDPATINGYPYTVDIGMASVDTANKPILFGDVSGYWIRDVVGFEFVRLDELYAASRQAGFLAWARMDARPVDAGDDPWKVLLMA